MSYDSTRSGNSNSNSKRSFNSNSSNNTNNKKKKTNQKTLGVAWGANSLTSSRSSFRSAPFSDFGSYMAVKNKKLHDQFDAEASNSSYSGSDSVKPIFQGVSIFVDGFTIPSSQELRAYMLKHGGRFENYFSRHRVTHIICSNLPDSKIKNLRSFSGGLPVVKPTWVLDCVAAGKLLNWVPYQLIQLANEGSNQPKLSAFFALKRNTVNQGVLSDSACMLQAEADAEASEVKDDVVLDHASSELGELSECSRQSEKKMEDDGCKKIGTADSEQFFEEDFSQPEKSVTSKDKVDISPTSHHDSYEKPSGDSSGSLAGGPSCCRHSTLEDPNFVENYFKSSRLHFIGTWRNRYRKRFACLSNKTKQKSFDVNAASTSRKTMIIHMDMDCFFVAVVIRNRPDLMDKPVAVCHSDSSRGTAEISSANYPARDYGVKAGMFVRDAKARCPHLEIIPYNFEAYEEVADQFYNILHKHCDKVQAVSCDEAFLDITDSDVAEPELLVSEIRKEIFKTTGCTASAGIASNMLMARLATRTAKPNGQCYISPEKVDEYLLQLPLKTLPGIGHVLEQKLKNKGVQTCGQLRRFSKEALQRDFGTKTGEMLWNYCRGVDNRLVGVIQESKSIGADVNWGVRFKDIKDSEHFLSSLCKEVSLRLQGCGLQGRTFTLKIKKRRKDAGEPTKYMGHGACENLSHSTTVPVATDDVDILQRITMQLFGSFHIDVKDIRGIGLQVTKLESNDTMRQGQERNFLRSWLGSGTTNSTEHRNMRDTGQAYLESVGPSATSSNPSYHESHSNPVAVLPSLGDLDLGVIESLPPELFKEFNDMYGGRLTDLISKIKDKDLYKSVSAMSVKKVEGELRNEQEIHASAAVQINNIKDDKAGCSENQEKEAGCSKNQEKEALPTIGTVTAIIPNSEVESGVVDLMPYSLSQVDMSILHQLPEELRADIVGALPAHRRPNGLPESCKVSEVAQKMGHGRDNTGSVECAKDSNLWVGSPPCWVHKFKVSNCLILNILAEMFLRSGSTGVLSSTLQCCLSGFQIYSDFDDVGNESSHNLCELLRQYIQLKLEEDIEEIYVCFRLLKRLTLKLKAFKHAYDAVLPYLQACISESYGGHLDLPAME
ncbi:DNA repair protein REV1-like [Chenopodium quinoa]|uniref:DNA repair protein REV1-like n=1 Tax=Chenopodium quinoa TaxID=63459 RepID=UPI000B7807A3|nr:DNA repair protein REV1-like [Chenopodium quinoa]XP_021750781.1 DNA repair protein REV1-like [Chenopodium quinoa]